MLNTSAAANYDPSKDPKRKAKSKDAGWKYGYWPNLNNKNVVRCVLCGKDAIAGIKRLKQHLVGGYGDIVKCPKTTPEIAKEMREALAKNKKKNLKEMEGFLDDSCEEDSPMEVEMEGLATTGSNRPSTQESQASTRVFPSSGIATKRKKVVQAQVKGPMDVHVMKTPEEVVSDRHAKGPTQTTIQSHFRSKAEKATTDSYVAKWFYEAGIPFNAVNRRSFEEMVEAIAQYGPGYRPPTCHELRLPLLKTEKDKIQEIRSTHEACWRTYGCSLMSDGWSDKSGRHLINFLVNSPEGSFFLGSVDASSQVQDANLLFKFLDEKIEEIGEENVIQVVTDNATNYRAACNLLIEKRTKLFWTPCAAYSINLMMQDISKLTSYEPVIEKAKRVTKFIYRHARLLDQMRELTGGRDLVRAAVTRFATSFLTLQSLFKYKDALRNLFMSDDWNKSKLAATKIGKKVVDTVFSTSVWNTVQDCIRASQPLLIVLRLVDGDLTPAMPEIYVAMEKAKQKIKENFAEKEKHWKVLINIIDQRWEKHMEGPLYGAAFFLNPGKYFECKKGGAANEVLLDKLSDDFNEVLSRLVPDDIPLQDKITLQKSMYSDVAGNFAKPMAVRQRDILSPIAWWKNHGNFVPELQKFAIRVLGLCCSTFGCERNWSTFEFIHTKKRNRLEHHRLNDLIYIQYNHRLQTRFREIREQGKGYHALQLAEFDWSGEGLIGKTNDEVVHHGDDLTWGDVDRAMGASTSIESHNRPRRGHASTTNANICYARRGRRRVVDEESLDEEVVEEEDVNDDEDIYDDEYDDPLSTNVTRQREQQQQQQQEVQLDDFI